jgi:outer membrane protein TolC
MKRPPQIAIAVALCCVAAARAGGAELTLHDCYQRVLANNPEIQRHRLELERAAGTKLVFVSRALPRLGAEARGGWREGTQYDPDGPFSVITARFAQPLFDAAVPASARRGTVEIVLAQQTLNVTLTEQLHETRLTFLRALKLRDLIRLHEQIGERLQANIQRQQQRLEAGTGTRAAVLQAQVQALDLQPAVAGLRLEQERALLRLAELLGQPIRGGTSLPVPAGELQQQPATVQLADEVNRALRRRPDLRLLRALGDAVAEDRRIARAGFFPFVTLTASGMLIPENELLSREPELVAGRDPRASEYRAGVALSWRVVDSGEVAGRLRRLQAARQTHQITLRALQENIPRQIARAVHALETADARLAGLRKNLEQAGENLRLVEVGIALGEATQLDFLAAQRNLLAVRAGIVEALFEHEAARAELDLATGRYLDFVEEPR